MLGGSGMKRALITGISGFVGSYLAKQLLCHGWEVFGLVRRSLMPEASPQMIRLGIASAVSVFQSDITELASIANALSGAKPDVIFHLAAQSYVPRSFLNPLETFLVNTTGTANLLEAVRLQGLDCKVLFAGSSEEYGLQFVSEDQYDLARRKYGVVFPPPESLPELPINERNPLRPMSPYAVSKVQADYLTQNYHYAYRMKTIVSRGFNQEGAGRSDRFVTAGLVSQCVRLIQGETQKIVVGNVNAFRDWSHVLDIVDGYLLLADKAAPGEIYVQGSMRMHSVLTYLLMTLQEVGYQIEAVETLSGQKRLELPLAEVRSSRFGVSWLSNALDTAMIERALEYEPNDRGLTVTTNRGKVLVEFDLDRLRPAEVPMILSDIRKIQKLGFKIQRSLRDVIRDQINYYLDGRNTLNRVAIESRG